jgi:23S rRNA (uracil1939-C5)-methyltransferase
MQPEQSLAAKQRRLESRLYPWADHIRPVQSVNENDRWNYRLKVCLRTEWDASGWRFGLVKQKTVIPIHDCPVHGEPVRRAVALLADRLPAGTIFPAVYYLQSGGQATLVVKTNVLPDLAWLDAYTMSRLSAAGVEGLWIHLHPAAGKRVLGKNGWHLVWGAPESIDKTGLVYGPASFRQVIGSLSDHALSAAEAFLNPCPHDLMIDLYCGIGAGLARWHARQCRTLGVELGREAVSCARRNAPGATLLRGRCELRLPQLTEWVNSQTAAGNPARLLFANPPRTGIEAGVLEWITNTYQPARMAYLSCNADSLRRDLSCLASNGYSVRVLLPYDFFPRTHHMECLALIEAV